MTGVLGGVGADARLTRVHRLAVSPDGMHLLTTQAHAQGGVMRLIRISDGNTSGAEEFGPGGAAGMQDGYNSDGRLDSPRGVAFFPGNGDKAVGTCVYAVQRKRSAIAARYHIDAMRSVSETRHMKYDTMPV